MNRVLTRTRLPRPATGRGLRRHALAVAAAAALALAMPAAQAVTYTWTGGIFVPGSTAPSPLDAADTLDINAGGNKFFNAVAFDNAGTVNWNADPLYFQSGAAVVNNGLWNATGDNTLIYNGGVATSFTNHGVFRKSGGLGATTINAGVGFVNHGTLDAQTGSIQFAGGSVFNAGTVFTGAGSINMVGGTNTFNGSFNAANLRLTGGTHLGVGAVLNGSARWTGGDLSGTWAVAAGQTLEAHTGVNKFLTGGTLTNQGTLAWNTGDLLYLQSGGVLRNEGLFAANQSLSLVYNGGVATAFENTASGTVSAASGSTLTVGSGVGFVNDGGTLQAQAGGSIRYAGGSVFNTGTQFTGAGTNVAAGNNSFSGALHSANLRLESGIHQGSAAVIHGSAVFSGGTLSGGWSVAAGQTLNAASGINKFLSGAGTVLSNQGDLNWATTDLLYMQSGASVDNQGLFLASESTAVTYNGGTATGFANSGTVRAAAGKTLTFGNVSGLVNNAGVLDAQAGGSIVYASGAVFNAGSQFTGAGSNVAAGNNSWNGAFQSSNLVLQSGVHSGNGAVLGGAAAFTGGYLEGGWEVAPGQALNARDGINKFISGAATVLTNQGTVDWASTSPLYMQSGGAVSNQGLFLASETFALIFNGGAATSFDNTATGTVRAAAGKTLTLGAGSGFANNGGVLDAQAGGSIVYASGSVFNSGTQFTGAGSNVAAGNNSWNGAFTTSNLVLQSGVHSGSGAVLAGSATFAGGTLTGTWDVAPGQALVAANGGVKFISGGGTVLSNQGSLTWATSDTMYLMSGAALLNQGTLDFAADNAVIFNGGAATTFTNTGLLLKSGGAGTTSIGNGLNFDNQGVVDVQTGTLALPANFSNNGTLMGTGSYAVAGTLFNDGSVAPGASPGTLALAGNYLQGAGGSFAVDLESLASHDLFNISGSAALGGTLALSCHAACSYAVGDVFTILDAVGELSGSFSQITLSGFASGAFDVIYDTAGDRVQLQVTEAVTAVPEPGSWALMAAGLLAVARLARRRQR